MKIKVCGVTREDNIVQLLRVGVDFIGFNLIAASPRAVTLSFALAMSKKYELGAKFVVLLDNPAPETVSSIVAENSAAAFQLYNAETEPGAANLPAANLLLKPTAADALGAADFERRANLKYLVDNMRGGGLGGSGEKFDWGVLEGRELGDVMVAGGVAAADIPTIKAMGAWGVDLNSKLESAPGVKDAAKIEELKRYVG